MVNCHSSPTHVSLSNGSITTPGFHLSFLVPLQLQIPNGSGGRPPGRMGGPAGPMLSSSMSSLGLVHAHPGQPAGILPNHGVASTLCEYLPATFDCFSLTSFTPQYLESDIQAYYAPGWHMLTLPQQQHPQYYPHPHPPSSPPSPSHTGTMEHGRVIAVDAKHR
jgi:hypothetical protein